MKKTIDIPEFIQAFADHGREDNFSREGLVHLFDYLEEIDPEMELNVISICCKFEELTLDDLPDAYSYLVVDDEDADKYSLLLADDEDEDDLDMDYWVSILSDHTTVIWHDNNSVLFAQF